MGIEEKAGLGRDSRERRRTPHRPALVVYNPRAGSAGSDALRAIQTAFAEAGWTTLVHVVDDRAHDELARVVEATLQAGVDLVVAAGGDGTVAAVG